MARNVTEFSMVQSQNGFIAKLNLQCDQIKKLLEKGYEIHFFKTENWCEINGKTFNVSKRVLVQRGIL